MQEGKCLEDVEREENCAIPAEMANSSFAVQHALRKAELCKQLQELTKALAMKEEIASKMVDNERITSMRKQHEASIAKKDVGVMTCSRLPVIQMNIYQVADSPKCPQTSRNRR